MSPEESKHCVRVLRFAEGEPVALVDGKGNWFRGEIERADAKGCKVRITEKTSHYGRRPFRLHLAVAPTKNLDRMEWMLEKCTEMGIDEITLLNTEHSERKVVKEERFEKGRPEGCKFIAHCPEGEKKRLDEVYAAGEDVVILIGPEGDFSPEEVECARREGFVPITLGTSRLRTETAGMVACHSINFMNRI